MKAKNSTEFELLKKIKDSSDIKKLSEEELLKLCEEIRKKIMLTVAETGGHLSTNLGVVEITVALHYCFDFPKDTLIFDVGHQVYPHKLLTGRFEKFSTLRKKGGISGYPNPKESKYDMFITGHSSTSISSALGVQVAKDINNENTRTIVLIGDGAMTAGLAFEGLNHAGDLKKNLLVILNDNTMAISRTVGALSEYLNKFRTQPLYVEMKEEIDYLLEKVPIIGKKTKNVLHLLLETAEKTMLPGTVFTQLGFHYYGPIDGHNISSLIETLNNIKEVKGPVLLHIYTQKGKGFLPAQNNPTLFHSASPFDIYNVPSKEETKKEKTYTATFSEKIVELANKFPNIVSITAAMPDGVGLIKFKDTFPERYFDVGIAEQHAVVFAAGLAKKGLVPFVPIYSTFLQRAYDQIFHDVCLQEDIAVIFLMDRAGLVGSDGPTHHGVFDIAYLRHIPNMVLMAPATSKELEMMMEFAYHLKKPCAIRYPKDKIYTNSYLDSIPIEYAKGTVVVEGDKNIIILNYGALLEKVLNSLKILKYKNITPTVINMRFAKPIDTEILKRYCKDAEFIFTVEDHTVKGGFGSAILEELNAIGICKKVNMLGVPDKFIEHATREEQLTLLGLDDKGIANTILKTINYK